MIILGADMSSSWLQTCHHHGCCTLACSTVFVHPPPQVATGAPSLGMHVHQCGTAAVGLMVILAEDSHATKATPDTLNAAHLAEERRRVQPSPGACCEPGASFGGRRHASALLGLPTLRVCIASQRSRGATPRADGRSKQVIGRGGLVIKL